MNIKTRNILFFIVIISVMDAEDVEKLNKEKNSFRK
jgi:hypothetical protein